MKIAAHQAPLLPGGSMESLELIRGRLKWCESEDVHILCRPESVLGGLADDVKCPADIAFDIENRLLEAVLAPLVSNSVTVIVGFTEATSAGKLYNAALARSYSSSEQLKGFVATHITIAFRHDAILPVHSTRKYEQHGMRRTSCRSR
jgi:hypothetical protein